jgi:hypothetical protein
MPRRRRTRAVDQLLPDVQAAVHVKYNPEMSALTALLSEAASQRDQTIAGAEAGRQGILNAMRGIAPMVQTAYHSAGLDPSPAINALGSYGSQAAQAAIGQRRQALDQYRADVGKIQQRQQDLQSEAGDYAVTELNRLLEARAGRSLTRRGQDKTAAARAADRALRGQSQAETQRHNIAMENRPTRGSGGSGGRGGKSPWLPPASQMTANKQISGAQGWVQRLGKAIPSSTLRQWLLTGYTIPAEKDKSGHVTTPAVRIPAYPKWAINAAYDLQVKRGLSPANVNALHAQGIKIHGRYPTLGGPRKTGRKIARPKAPSHPFG